MSRAREIDTVKLVRDVDSWPAGTVGAVVSVCPDSALIEVVTVDLRG